MDEFLAEYFMKLKKMTDLCIIVHHNEIVLGLLKCHMIGILFIK